MANVTIKTLFTEAARLFFSRKEGQVHDDSITTSASDALRLLGNELGVIYTSDKKLHFVNPILWALASRAVKKGEKRVVLLLTLFGALVRTSVRATEGVYGATYHESVWWGKDHISLFNQMKNLAKEPEGHLRGQHSVEFAYALRILLPSLALCTDDEIFQLLLTELEQPDSEEIFLRYLVESRLFFGCGYSSTREQKSLNTCFMTFPIMRSVQKGAGMIPKDSKEYFQVEFPVSYLDPFKISFDYSYAKAKKGAVSVKIEIALPEFPTKAIAARAGVRTETLTFWTEDEAHVNKVVTNFHAEIPSIVGRLFKDLTPGSDLAERIFVRHEMMRKTRENFGKFSLFSIISSMCFAEGIRSQEELLNALRGNVLKLQKIEQELITLEKSLPLNFEIGGKLFPIFYQPAIVYCKIDTKEVEPAVLLKGLPEDEVRVGPDKQITLGFLVNGTMYNHADLLLSLEAICVNQARENAKAWALNADCAVGEVKTKVYFTKRDGQEMVLFYTMEVTPAFKQQIVTFEDESEARDKAWTYSKYFRVKDKLLAKAEQRRKNEAEYNKLLGALSFLFKLGCFDDSIHYESIQELLDSRKTLGFEELERKIKSVQDFAITGSQALGLTLNELLAVVEAKAVKM